MLLSRTLGVPKHGASILKPLSLTSSRIRTNSKMSINQRRNFGMDTIQPILDIMAKGSDALVYLHSTTGLPWWALIPITTIVIRSVTTLPLAIYQRRGLQTQNKLRPIIGSMTPVLRLKLAANAQRQQIKHATNPAAEIKNGADKLNGDKIVILAAKEKIRRQRELFKENNCQVWKYMFLPAFQIPLWVSLSYSFRVLTGWNDIGNKPVDTSLTTEGFGWVTDLSVSDPFMMLPVTLGFLALSNAEWNFKTADLMKLTTRGVKNSLTPSFFDSVITISRGSIIFLMVISTQAPAALVLYWISSNGFSLVQNLVLDRIYPLRYSPYDRFINSNAKKESLPLIKV